MAQYIKCPHCGANLDSGEKCDCQKEAEKMQSAECKVQNSGEKLPVQFY